MNLSKKTRQELHFICCFNTSNLWQILTASFSITINTQNNFLPTHFIHFPSPRPSSIHCYHNDRLRNVSTQLFSTRHAQQTHVCVVAAAAAAAAAHLWKGQQHGPNWIITWGVRQTGRPSYYADTYRGTDCVLATSVFTEEKKWKELWGGGGWGY